MMLRPHTILTLLLTTGAACAFDVRVRPDKIRVAPGSPVILQVAVTNLPPGVSAAITCRIRHRLNDLAATLHGTTKPDGTLDLSFTPAAPWGYEANVTAQAGGDTASDRTTFACANNPYLVAASYAHASLLARQVALPDGSPAPLESPLPPRLQEELEAEVAWSRRFRSSVTEIMGPAFCSFSAIRPWVNNYFKGKSYYFSGTAIRALIAALHDNGIASVMYVNACLSSISGYEFARRHPEYLAYTPDGMMYGQISTRTVQAHQEYLENYPASFQRAQTNRTFRRLLTSDYPGLLNARLDFRNPELSRIAAEKIIEGQEYFGFDGVRYDGSYNVPSIGDPMAPSRDYRNYKGEKQPVGMEAERMTARNHELAFGLLRAHDPDFLLGFNCARFRSDASGDRVFDSPWIKTLSPGSWILDETAKGALSPARAENKWENFYRVFSEQADRVHRVGNVLCAGWGGGPGQKRVDTLQLVSAAWACGLNWKLGGYPPKRPGQVHPYTDDYAERCHFVYRYGEFILNTDLQRISHGTVTASMTVDGSRPVIFERFAYRLNTEDGRAYFIAHFLNRPVEDRLTVDAVEPPPANNVRVRMDKSLPLPGPADLSRAMLLSPDRPTWARPLEAQAVGPAVEFTIPEIKYWAVAVIPAR